MGRLDLSRKAAASIRVARSGDLDSIMAVEESAFTADDRFPRRSWARLIHRPTALCLVLPRLPDLPSDGIPECIATIAWLLRKRSSLARMYSLSVHPVARGRGLARALISSSLRRLPRHIGVLGLEVRSDNTAAVGLYCSLGFVETARLPGYYGPGRPGLRLRAARLTVELALS